MARAGEELAARFLEDNGYRTVERNFKCRMGEVDIIARDKDVYCFVEVKTRSSDRFGSGQEAVSRSKQQQVSKAALHYLKANKLLDQSARFDVVSVVSCNGSRKADLIKNAFELDHCFTY